MNVISMFTTERMTKIRIVGPETKLSLVVDTLYNLHLMHLIDHRKNDVLDIGRPLDTSEQISALLVQVKSIVSSFPPSLVSYSSSKQSFSLKTVQQTLHTHNEQFVAMQHRLASLQTLITEKKQTAEQLRILAALHLTPDAVLPYASLTSFIGTVSSDKGLSSSLLAVVPDAYIRTALCNTTHFVAVFVPRTHTQAIQHVLQHYSYKPYTFTAVSSSSGDPHTEAKKISVAIGLLEKDLAYAQKELLLFQTTHAASLLRIENYLSEQATKTQVPLRFGQTKHSFFIEGWVTLQEYRGLKDALEKQTEHKIYLEILNITKTDKIPIILKNMFFVKPFEFFLHLYTLPNYKEMDPSFFIFFTFPFFFGLMLGDVGYGFVTLLLFALLWWKLPSGRHLLHVMMISACVSIFFGFLFGEYFGVEHVSAQTGTLLSEQYGFPLHQEVLHNGEVVYSFPRLMNRLHGEVEILGTTLPMVLVLGGILGFIHVNFGLFLGFINEVISNGFAHAFLTKMSWYILELGFALLALSGMISFHWGIGLGVIFLAALLLFIGEGVQGLVELPSIITNILSYLRLGAVGLSSVGLAVVINENLALPFMEKGGMYVFLAVFVFILGHLINIALGVIGPFLHALRLHYVEFFSKFYKGGGIPFVAFGEQKKSS